jgi:hypothetical protein
VKSEYQPNVVGVAFRSLFAVFAKKRVRFTLAEYEHMPGSFFALWKGRMLHAASLRDNFATNPERAHFDKNENYKLRHNASPEFDLEGNFDDLISLYYWFLSTNFMLRGSKEVCKTFTVILFVLYTTSKPLFFSCIVLTFAQPSELKISDLEMTTKDSGEFHGMRALRIKGLSGDKTYKLSLKVTELRNVSEQSFDDMIENPKDKFCIVRLHELVIARYRAADSTYNGRIFRRAVKRKGKSTHLPNMKPTGVIGRNQFAVITKAIAHRTGMDRPEKCTPSARRRKGITSLANEAAGCSESVRMRAARHTCPTTHALYQDPSGKMMAGRYKAFIYDDADYGKCAATNSFTYTMR